MMSKSASSIRSKAIIDPRRKSVHIDYHRSGIFKITVVGLLITTLASTFFFHKPELGDLSIKSFESAN